MLLKKLKFIAKENDVMMVENRPLARALYDQTEIGDTIPEEFFKAVAEILAYVYRTKNIVHRKCQYWSYVSLETDHERVLGREYIESKRFNCHCKCHYDCCHAHYSASNMVIKCFLNH